jgi:hypothetical protein
MDLVLVIKREDLEPIEASFRDGTYVEIPKSWRGSGVCEPTLREEWDREQSLNTGSLDGLSATAIHHHVCMLMQPYLETSDPANPYATFQGQRRHIERGLDSMRSGPRKRNKTLREWAQCYLDGKSRRYLGADIHSSMTYYSERLSEVRPEYSGPVTPHDLVAMTYANHYRNGEYGCFSNYYQAMRYFTYRQYLPQLFARQGAMVGWRDARLCRYMVKVQPYEEGRWPVMMRVGDFDYEAWLEDAERRLRALYEVHAKFQGKPIIDIPYSEISTLRHSYISSLLEIRPLLEMQSHELLPKAVWGDYYPKYLPWYLKYPTDTFHPEAPMSERFQTFPRGALRVRHDAFMDLLFTESSQDDILVAIQTEV